MHPEAWSSCDEGDGALARPLPLSDTLVQRLQRFGTYGQLKKVALRAVATRVAADTDVVQQLRSSLEGAAASGGGAGAGLRAAEGEALMPLLQKVPYTQVGTGGQPRRCSRRRCS
jgi:hypothetical protein